MQNHLACCQVLPHAKRQSKVSVYFFCTHHLNYMLVLQILCSNSTFARTCRSRMVAIFYSKNREFVLNIVASSASVSTRQHETVQTSESRNALVSLRGKSIQGTFPYPYIYVSAVYIHRAYVCLQHHGFALLQCCD